MDRLETGYWEKGKGRERGHEAFPSSDFSNICNRKPFCYSSFPSPSYRSFSQSFHSSSVSSFLSLPTPPAQSSILLLYPPHPILQSLTLSFYNSLPLNPPQPILPSSAPLLFSPSYNSIPQLFHSILTESFHPQPRDIPFLNPSPLSSLSSFHPRPPDSPFLNPFPLSSPHPSILHAFSEFSSYHFFSNPETLTFSSILLSSTPFLSSSSYNFIPQSFPSILTLILPSSTA